MAESYVPEGFTRVTPFLTVHGARQLLKFLVNVFDAEVVDETDGPDGRLAHAAVKIGDSAIELADATEQFGPMQGAVHIYVPNVDEVHKRALEAGAHEIHGPMEMDYGERASAIRDAAGNHWYVATYRSS